MIEWLCVFRNRQGVLRYVYIAAETVGEAWLARNTHARPGEKLIEVRPLP